MIDIIRRIYNSPRWNEIKPDDPLYPWINAIIIIYCLLVFIAIIFIAGMLIGGWRP